MWKMHLKLRHDDCPIVTRAQKFKVTVYSYPSTWYSKGSEKRVTTICFMHGSPEGKTLFLNDLQNDPHLTRLETEGDIFTYEFRLHAGGQHVQLYYPNELVFVEPVLNSPEGFEYWHVASWEKKALTKFFRQLSKKMDYCEILSLGKSKLTNVYFPNIMPRLTPKQWEAMQLAYENGYYRYPRKIQLRELARLAGSALSSFQERLRKAEAVLLPHLMEKYIGSSAERELVIKARLRRSIPRRMG